MDPEPKTIGKKELKGVFIRKVVLHPFGTGGSTVPNVEAHKMQAALLAVTEQVDVELQCDGVAYLFNHITLSEHMRGAYTSKNIAGT